MKKGVLIFIVVCALGLLYVLYNSLDKYGVFDKEYTREELVSNFKQKEPQFEDLVAYFKENTTTSDGDIVSFCNQRSKAVNLTISPSIIDSANTKIGGKNLELGSPRLLLAMRRLKWTDETVQLLSEKLHKAGCDCIRTTNNYGRPIQLFPRQKGWSSFTYYVFDSVLSNRLIEIHGQPISETLFGRRVVLSFSTAL